MFYLKQYITNMPTCSFSLNYRTDVWHFMLISFKKINMLDVVVTHNLRDHVVADMCISYILPTRNTSNCCSPNNNHKDK